jgi:hypothetical protein
VESDADHAQGGSTGSVDPNQSGKGGKQSAYDKWFNVGQKMESAKNQGKSY